MYKNDRMIVFFLQQLMTFIILFCYFEEKIKFLFFFFALLPRKEPNIIAV